jgi:hypothetical protein
LASAQPCVSSWPHSLFDGADNGCNWFRWRPLPRPVSAVGGPGDWRALPSPRDPFPPPWAAHRPLSGPQPCAAVPDYRLARRSHRYHSLFDSAAPLSVLLLLVSLSARLGCWRLVRSSCRCLPRESSFLRLALLIGRHYIWLALELISSAMRYFFATLSTLFDGADNGCCSLVSLLAAAGPPRLLETDALFAPLPSPRDLIPQH